MSVTIMIDQMTTSRSAEGAAISQGELIEDASLIATAKDAIKTLGVFSMLASAVLTAASPKRAEYPPFDRDNDLLLAQFDGRPDADDIHAQAALGCMLRHPSFAGIKVYAVMNAYGIQSAQSKIWDSSSLMDMIFGPSPHGEHWTNADKPKTEGGNGTGNWPLSVTRVKDTVKTILQNEGRVWLQEAGQSSFTADWIRALIAEGLPKALIKTNVILVQHSTWNENKTSPNDLEFVKNHTFYVKLASGNHGDGDPEDPLNDTPNYKTDRPQVAQHAELKSWAKSDLNPNRTARKYWTEADRLIGDWTARYSTMGDGGLDFSDCVENWWIFDLGPQADTIEKFWDGFVTNEPAPEASPPHASGKPTNQVRVLNLGR